MYVNTVLRRTDISNDHRKAAVAAHQYETRGVHHFEDKDYSQAENILDRSIGREQQNVLM